MQGRWKRFFLLLPPTLYHDVTEETKLEYFWFPLGSSHDWNCPAFVQEILQCNMQRCIAAGGKKNNPTHISCLTAWKTWGVHRRVEHHHLVPPHPTLLSAWVQAVLVQCWNRKSVSVAITQNILLFCLLIVSSSRSSCVLCLQNYPCLYLMQRLFCKAQRLTPPVPSLTQYLLQFIPFQS